jgi:hypothetical protein
MDNPSDAQLLGHVRLAVAMLAAGYANFDDAACEEAFDDLGAMLEITVGLVSGLEAGMRMKDLLHEATCVKVPRTRRAVRLVD